MSSRQLYLLSLSDVLALILKTGLLSISAASYLSITCKFICTDHCLFTLNWFMSVHWIRQENWKRVYFYCC